MTDNSPSLWAAADLDPISPSPVYPPSPIIVPALQDQAEAYFGMSSTDNKAIPPAVAPAANASESSNKQNHAQSAAAIIHNNNNNHNMASGVPDTEAEGAGLDKATNGVAQRAETASINISGRCMQEPKTGQPDAIKAEQDVSQSNKLTLSSDTSAPVRDIADVAAQPHKSNPPISQTPSDALPSLLPQTSHHQLPEDDRIVPDMVTSVINSNPGEQPITNNNLDIGTTSHASRPDIDIQAILDNIATYAADTNAAHIPTSKSAASSDGTLQTTILRPKLPSPELTFTQSNLSTDELASCIPKASQSSSVLLPSSNGPALVASAGAAPATYLDAVQKTVDLHAHAIVPLDATSMRSHATSLAQSDSANGSVQVEQTPLPDHARQPFETFLREERKYVADGKWDRFPEGSRIFIGNLSSERVSKRDVFDIFSQYGRLAQVSLKQAYGFVQYHTVAEAQEAMDHLQGMDIRGKKINLEFSRIQRKDSEGNRGNRGKRDSDRRDSHRGRRDDYRPGRDPSPRRGKHRQAPSSDGTSWGRDYRDRNYSTERRRSQTPGYDDRDSYRRRSRSPYRRYASGADLDVPRRYETVVPDVQFVLIQEVARDFVSWAQGAFIQQGLTVDVMLLDPQVPRDAVIQRQALRGVHAVIELDFRAQDYGRLPLQVFNRSAGYDNVRFDQYQDLEPSIAAQLVARTKSQSQVLPAPYHGQYPPAQLYPPPGPQGHYMSSSYPGQNYQPPTAQPLDSATVHSTLGSLNGQQGGPQPYVGGPAVDVNSLLTTLGAPTPHGNGMGGPPPPQHGVAYEYNPTNPAQPPPTSDSNSARHVQDIMSQLTRYRK
ncbi:hypothetical protein F5Y14DRAFT_271721 [Nemania sp. NC0429]|nr:hypothetical protein F5Y14DRAFT_271721 [Nemania sp. NC0429]